MKNSDIIEIIVAPEVQVQRERLVKLGAPVGQIQLEAFTELRNNPGTLTREEEIVFVANCLLHRVKEWEAKRNPKTWVGRILKWIDSIFRTLGK